MPRVSRPQASIAQTTDQCKTGRQDRWFYKSGRQAAQHFPPTRPNVMDTPKLERCLDILRSLSRSDGDRVSKAQRAIDLIRELGSYRWAGLYDVLPNEIAVIAWSGPEAPTYPRFPVTQGLNGACVASRKPVIVQDVANDPRYLTTIGGTRGEMIQPVFDHSGAVIGTIDVESDRVNAFSSRDEELLSLCAEHLSWLWRASS